ncbi:SNF2 family N-terminal domain-containing protein [Kockiozyma suomiensis]|uniref:SNF2 family N-terminal domain-containing protein n=1 Tax=Kockiozyma suomiensis TaxID=1337062 RepID=UPI00334344BA
MSDPFEPFNKRRKTDASLVTASGISPVSSSSAPESAPRLNGSGNEFKSGSGSGAHKLMRPSSRAAPLNGVGPVKTNTVSSAGARPHTTNDSFYGSLVNGRSNGSGGNGTNSAGNSSPFPMLFSRSNALLSKMNGTAAANHPTNSGELSPQSKMRNLAAKFRADSSSSTLHQRVPLPNTPPQLARKGQAVTKIGAVQRGPAPARPVAIDIDTPEQVTYEERRVIARLQEVFPSFANSALLSAVRLKRNFDDAADWLSQQDELRVGALMSPTSVTQDQVVELSPVPTSKRDIVKPRRSIREKFSAAKMIELSSDVELDDDLEVTGVAKPTKPNDFVNQDQSDEEELAISENSDSEMEVSAEEDNSVVEERLLQIFNEESAKVIIDVACCPEDVAERIIDQRPYSSLYQVRLVDLVAEAEPGAPAKKKSRRPKRTVGDKAADTALETLSGYDAVDSLIHKCEQLGLSVSNAIKNWGVDVRGSNGELEIVDIAGSDDDDVDGKKEKMPPGGGYFAEQPAILGEGVQLKSYQQVGINWLALLYKKKLSCILADEMGLGKTCQVIAFISHLKEIGVDGPHLVVVPSSTLENWLREFQRFSPTLVVEPYYGAQKERGELRAMLSDPNTEFDVIVTTYNLATGSPLDCSFLRSFKFSTCIYDEGHLLKNSESERYQKLMRLKSNFRLLLTGTPLQNNLQELISLLAFILPHLFKERKEELAGIFKHKAKTTTDTTDASNMALLSAQRISRAKTMMTPFVLRRKKDQVLKHLPRKHHAVEYCELSPEQKEIYEAELEASRRVIEAREAGKVLTKADRSSSNVLMRLRKAAVHPLLFRRYYDESKLKKMSKEIMKEERYYDANQQYIFEDMEVMSDFELHGLCSKFKSIYHHRLQNDEWMNSGKVQKLKELLVPMKANGDRILIFSQFTQTLDILEQVLSGLDMTFLRLDGQTSVEVRQDLIDKFYAEEDITCFLLSTKAGGFGINLACANVVVIFDMSFNPHDDKQAEDRAHRVGQMREVRVVRLVSKGTIEEAILQLANTKLALDASVSAGGEEQDTKTEEKNAGLVEEILFKKK